MSSSQSEAQQKVTKIVQELLLDETDKSKISPSLIAEKIDLVLLMQPKWAAELDRLAVTDELIRRFSIWVGEDAVLKSEVGHIPWLDAARKKEWRYWQRYREWVERSLSPIAIEAMGKTTDTILGLLEDPTRDGEWDRRGLVVGHVQSGKTGNYTGLICKAADAGYKIIIVLAGLHNNLRAQTQTRLDEGFLGFETAPGETPLRVIGVGEVDSDSSITPNYATNRSEKGDFNSAVAKNFGIKPEQRPWLFVVKKNASVLRRLHEWIRDHVANTFDPSRERRVVSHLPLLLIDDEADNASVDTGEEVIKDDGTPDEEHRPTVINGWIRQIMYSFRRSAYVGYTATPFANIFIHERGTTKKEGPDLFPSAFVVNLAAGSNYVGPARIFGIDAADSSRGLPLIRPVSDAGTDSLVDWMPSGHKSTHVPLFYGQNSIPGSLKKAIQSFILACAARSARGQARQHSSMLVHVTRFTAVQGIVAAQIEAYLRHTRQRITRGIDDQEIISEIRGQWEEDFVPTTLALRQANLDPIRVPELTWAEVVSILPETLEDVRVKIINGTAKDALDYVQSAETGLKVIAIGGDKLSRGLTLEGLCTSYFLRASRMYDTLMQMGRWFGYRPGYLDLCRLYTTLDLIEWFKHITIAAEELREEFDLMSEAGGTPRDYGLKVQSHSTLLVTSPLKMRTARDLEISFSGQLLETVVFFRDADKLSRNFSLLKSFVARQPEPERDPKRVRNGTVNNWEGGFLWNDVPAVDVTSFLRSYVTHPKARRVNSLLLAEFIESLSQEAELTQWTVALIGASDGSDVPVTQEITGHMLKRTHEPAEGDDRYSIGRLMSPRDESIALDDQEWEAALERTRRSWHADPGRSKAREEPDVPSGPSIRHVGGFGAPEVPARRDRGFLALYLLDPQKAAANFPDGTPPIVAFGIAFPASTSGRKVAYKANNVLWQQDYGSSE